MTSRQRFLNACHNQPVDCTPLWVMRQAGRYLPEYRKLKESYSFLELAQTPELAAEVTLQPLKRFDLDAAVIFSDILVIPEAMGQPYHFREAGGIGMDYCIETAQQVDQLTTDNITSHLDYVAQAIQRVRQELKDQKAVLGFGGSPWTLATYMVEGGSSKEFSKIKSLAYSQPQLFQKLLQKITDALIPYFKMQIEAGADAIQIFDSWAALCPSLDYPYLSLQWIEQIVKALPQDFPIILYAKGAGAQIDAMQATGVQALSLDWTTSLPAVKKKYPHLALQGNLDPILMTLDPSIVKSKAEAILESMRGQTGHIFNLGHGITPQAKIANMETLVETVHNFR